MNQVYLQLCSFLPNSSISAILAQFVKLLPGICGINMNSFFVTFFYLQKTSSSEHFLCCGWCICKCGAKQMS